jgi:hypothetical protein
MVLDIKLWVWNTLGKRSVKTFGTLEGWSMKRITTVGCRRGDNCRYFPKGFHQFGVRVFEIQLLTKYPKCKVMKGASSWS